mmetsp:Transcript_30708/g.64387  ORF Transcript_30708/g.64387 Transcript_30708/m.64387 type:complete len:363 (+) Transcript_30708:881-1969(+)
MPRAASAWVVGGAAADDEVVRPVQRLAGDEVRDEDVEEEEHAREVVDGAMVEHIRQELVDLGALRRVGEDDRAGVDGHRDHVGEEHRAREVARLPHLAYDLQEHGLSLVREDEGASVAVDVEKVGVGGPQVGLDMAMVCAVVRVDLHADEAAQEDDDGDGHGHRGGQAQVADHVERAQLKQRKEACGNDERPLVGAKAGVGEDAAQRDHVVRQQRRPGGEDRHAREQREARAADFLRDVQVTCRRRVHLVLDGGEEEARVDGGAAEEDARDHAEDPAQLRAGVRQAEDARAEDLSSEDHAAHQPGGAADVGGLVVKFVGGQLKLRVLEHRGGGALPQRGIGAGGHEGGAGVPWAVGMKLYGL